jgi:hypothetical protein
MREERKLVEGDGKCKEVEEGGKEQGEIRCR